jgi:hypothetical protein
MAGGAGKPRKPGIFGKLFGKEEKKAHLDPEISHTKESSSSGSSSEESASQQA